MRSRERTTIRRDNHYLPRHYLKRWANDLEQVWTYAVLVSHQKVPAWRLRSTKGLAHHAHLYTRVATGGETDEVEKWLDAEFEAPAEDVLQKVVRNGRLSPDDWKCLARYVAAQDVRTPARLAEMMTRWRETVPDVLRTTLEESVRELEKAKREGRTPASRGHLYAGDFPSRATTEIEPGSNTGVLRVETVLGRTMWLFSLRHLLTHTAHVLERHHWTVLRPPPGLIWLTSDNPVVRLNYYSEGKYDLKGGWGRTNGEILMPLSPEHLLYTKIGARPPPRGERVRHAIAELFQRLTVENAYRSVFAVRPDDRVAETRPRRVDAAAYKAEREHWARWHEEQTQAERDLLKGNSYTTEGA